MKSIKTFWRVTDQLCTLKTARAPTDQSIDFVGGNKPVSVVRSTSAEAEVLRK
jgi:hypothetical protein